MGGQLAGVVVPLKSGQKVTITKMIPLNNQFEYMLATLSPRSTISSCPLRHLVANVASLADIAGPDDKKESYLGGLYASTLGPLVQTVTHPIDTATGLAKAVIGTQDLDEIAGMVTAGNWRRRGALRAGKWAQEKVLAGGSGASWIVDPAVTRSLCRAIMRGWRARDWARL